MKYLKSLCIALMGFILVGCNTEVAPLQIKPKILVSKGLFGGQARVPIVEIFSTVDNLIIQNVVANNGNCKMMAHRQQEFPKQLKYGQKAVAGYTTNCNLLKVEVITNQGNWTQEFSHIPEEFLNM